MKSWKKLMPWFVAALCFYFLIAFLFEGEPKAGYALREFSRFPVLLNGRIKPLDTVARTSLLILCGKQSLRVEDGQSLSAIEWLTELMARPEAADDRKVFKITNPDTLGALGLQEEENKNYSFSQFVPRARDIERQVKFVRRTHRALP